MGLNDLLKELEIEVDDEVKLADVKIEDLPEEQQPLFKKAMDIIAKQTDEIAAVSLVAKTLKEHAAKPEEKPEEKKPAEGIFGLEKDDPYAYAFETMAGMIGNIGVKTEDQIQADFEEDIKALALKDKSIVHVIPEMDEILKTHPTMRSDVNTLFALAKQTKERRVEKPKPTETAGSDSNTVQNPVQQKSIAEAFAEAEKNLK